MELSGFLYNNITDSRNSRYSRDVIQLTKTEEPTTASSKCTPRIQTIRQKWFEAL